MRVGRFYFASSQWFMLNFVNIFKSGAQDLLDYFMMIPFVHFFFAEFG